MLTQSQHSIFFKGPIGSSLMVEMDLYFKLRCGKPEAFVRKAMNISER